MKKKRIKRKRIYPEIGDVFQINPKGKFLLHGVVINNHINNINGDDLILILIFKDKADLSIALQNAEKEDLLIPPQIVGKEYWTRGYFYNISHVENIPKLKTYGFYSIGNRKFLDEYGKEVKEEPELLGTYGVATISGVARKINQELIISGIL